MAAGVKGPDIANIVKFYSLGDVEDSSSSLPAVRETFSDTLPGAFLPIASDEGGAKICLSLQNETTVRSGSTTRTES